jgi:hypothetical protein
VIEDAVVVVGFGVVEVEFEADSLLKRICKNLDN